MDREGYTYSTMFLRVTVYLLTWSYRLKLAKGIGEMNSVNKTSVAAELDACTLLLKWFTTSIVRQRYMELR